MSVVDVAAEVGAVVVVVASVPPPSSSPAASFDPPDPPVVVISEGINVGQPVGAYVLSVAILWYWNDVSSRSCVVVDGALLSSTAAAAKTTTSSSIVVRPDDAEARPSATRTGRAVRYFISYYCLFCFCSVAAVVGLFCRVR
jgi:hypothetical protein